MNKINLIIDALNDCKGFTLFDDVAITEALAAARELKALKPVAWVDWSMDGSQYSDTETSYGTPLYALDEVTK
jgi:hypothetical protein